MTLPDGLEAYSRTAEFTETRVPPGLLRSHATKAGAWGLIHVLEGRLAYRITDPCRTPEEIVLTPDAAPGVVEPAVLHEVEPLGAVRFYVEFHRVRSGAPWRARSDAAERRGDRLGRPSALGPIYLRRRRGQSQMAAQGGLHLWRSQPVGADPRQGLATGWIEPPAQCL
jgi:tellurite resistance-related uncharacterized protein